MTIVKSKVELFLIFKAIILFLSISNIYATNFFTKLTAQAIYKFLNKTNKSKKNKIKLINNNIPKRSVSISTTDGKALQVTTDKFIIEELTGNTTIAGNLDVDGTTTLNQLRLSDGSETSPSCAFINQANTGLYRSTVNNLSISANGINQAIFDSNGGRLKSNFKVIARRSSNQTITSGTVQFNTTDLNPLNSFNTSTFTFTAPVSGVYFVSVHIGFSGGSGDRTAMLIKNGASMVGYSGTTSVVAACTVIGCISLTVSDTLRVDFTSGSSTTILANSSLFSIHLLSI